MCLHVLHEGGELTLADFTALPHCCGIAELGHIRDDFGPEDSLMSVDYEELGAHVVFSVTSADTNRHAIGRKLADFIQKNKLGEVVETKGARNPGHDGTLKAWIWTPNKKALKSWQAKMRKAKPERYRQRAHQDPYYNPYGGMGWW